MDLDLSRDAKLGEKNCDAMRVIAEVTFFWSFHALSMALLDFNPLRVHLNEV